MPSLDSSHAVNLSGPSLHPPAGAIIDLNNPPTPHYIVPVLVACTVLSSFFFLVRLYSKFLAPDLYGRDFVTALAFVFYYLLLAGNWYISHVGEFMVHQWNLRLENLAYFLHLAFLQTICYVVLTPFIKAAILLEWMAIFVPRGTRNYFFVISWCTIVAIALFNLIALILSNVNCTPYDGNWNPLASGRYCRFSVPAMALSSAVFNLCADLVILSLPQKIIWGLQTTWKKRLGVSIVFLAGLLGVGSAVLRLAYTVIYLNSDDITYFYGVIGLLSMVENSAAVLVLCVPFLPKALAGLGQNRIISSLRSWVSFLGTSRASSNQSWPDSSSKGPKDKSRPYQELDKQPLATSIIAPAGSRPHAQAATGITRVTEFTMDDEYTLYPKDSYSMARVSSPKR